MNLSEVQKILEMQVESDPGFARAVSAIKPPELTLTEETAPEATPAPQAEDVLAGCQTAVEHQGHGK